MESQPRFRRLLQQHLPVTAYRSCQVRLRFSARLKNADDLELLMRVLQANKALFTKANKLEPEILAKTDRPATKLSTSQSETQALEKADRPKAKTKANGSARKFLTVDRSEDEILTLT
jgi:hypothetical protein